MKKTFTVRNLDIRDSAAKFILLMKVDEDDIHEVIIKPHRKNRSLEQNALMWKWVTIISEDLGYTKNEMHDIYKEKFLIPIMLKNPKDFPDFCELVAAVREAREVDVKLADTIARKAAKLISTTKMKVKHMTEYLDDISKHAAGLNIALPASI